MTRPKTSCAASPATRAACAPTPARSAAPAVKAKSSSMPPPRSPAGPSQMQPAPHARRGRLEPLLRKLRRPSPRRHQRQARRIPVARGREPGAVRLPRSHPLCSERRRLPQPDLLRRKPAGLRVHRRLSRRPRRLLLHHREPLPRGPGPDRHLRRQGRRRLRRPLAAGLLPGRSLPAAGGAAERPDAFELGLQGGGQRQRNQGQEALREAEGEAQGPLRG